MRKYYLGSGLTQETFWAAGATKRDIVIIVATLAIGAAQMIGGHIWAPLVVIAIGGTLVGVSHVGSYVGVALGDRAAAWIAAWLAQAAGVGRFDEGVPWFAEGVQVAGFQPPGAAGEMAVILRDPDGLRVFKWRTVTLATTVIRLGGAFQGLDEWAVINNQARRFGELLKAAGNPRWGIRQIDVVTRIRPASLEAQQAWDDSRGAGAEAAEMRALVAAQASQQETWLTVTCEPRLLGDGDWLDRVCAGAWEPTVEMVRQAAAAGLDPYRVISPQRLAGTLRSLLTPDSPADPDTSLDGPWAGIPRIRTTPIGVVTDTGWWHSTAVVNADGWPADTVGPDFMDDLLGDIPGAPYRLVVSQLGMMPRRLAQNKARVTGTVAGAAALAEETVSDLTTGENRQHFNSAQNMLGELLEKGVGVMPVIRIMVSAKSRDDLLLARQAVRETLDTIGFTGDYWCDGIHGRMLGAFLMMGRGLKL